MNRAGMLQSSPVQQMMAAANPSCWWNLNTFTRPPLLSPHHQPPPHLLSPSSSSTSNLFPPQPPNLNHNATHNNTYNNNNNNGNTNTNTNNNNDNNNNNSNLFQAHFYNNINNNIPPATPSSSSWLDHQQQHFPESWSQLLMGGVCMGDDDDHEDETKKMGSCWEDHQVVLPHHHHHHPAVVDVKQESTVDNSFTTNVYSNQDQEFHQLAVAAKTGNWASHPPQSNNINNNIPASSPQSCVTTAFSSSNCNSNSMLDFSSSTSTDTHLPHHNNPTHRHPAPDRSSECNSTINGGTLKKAKVQPSSTQSTFKVRKEKLGDRITALHQLVSPFGKTDTASVLLEAIGYIRFLQNQIEALSLPYLSGGAGNKRQPHPVQGERNCIFPEDPGQLLNDNCLKRKGGPDLQDSCEEPKKDLRSRGLCLVPVSCTLQVGSDNGADYWAPALGSGFR